MAFAFQTGPVQIILGLFGLLCLYSLMQALRHRQFGSGLVLLAVLALSLLSLGVSLSIQAYTGLTSNALVAQVKASRIANSPDGRPMLSVTVTLHDPQGVAAEPQTYLVAGNEWMVQGDVIQVSPWLQMAGLHSGYKVTRLEGRFDDANLEHNAKHSVVELNGGDDAFFTWVRLLNFAVYPVITGDYGSAVIDGPGSYNVYVSQTGLWAKEK